MEVDVTDLKKGEQRGGGRSAGVGHSDTASEGDDRQRKADQSARGTNRDFDESGESRNQGHGHPREERGK